MTNTDICPFYEKIVKTRDKAICCDLCSKLIHIKCKNLNDLDYEYLKNKDKTWCCNTLSEKKNDNENLANCKYKDKSYFTSLDVKLKSKYLSFFHLKMNSLSKNLDNFNHDIKEPKLEFDILRISESFQFISVYFRVISFQS